MGHTYAEIPEDSLYSGPHLGAALEVGANSAQGKAMARRGGAWAWAATAAALLWWMAAGAGAVWLEIPPSATKCVSEEIQSNVVVIGDYSVLYEHHLNPTVTVKVCALCRGINLGLSCCSTPMNGMTAIHWGGF